MFEASSSSRCPVNEVWPHRIDPVPVASGADRFLLEIGDLHAKVLSEQEPVSNELGDESVWVRISPTTR